MCTKKGQNLVCPLIINFNFYSYLVVSVACNATTIAATAAAATATVVDTPAAAPAAPADEADVPAAPLAELCAKVGMLSDRIKAKVVKIFKIRIS